MCGRFASTQIDADLVWAFRVEEVVGEQLAPSYNIAPTKPVRAVLERTPREEPDGETATAGFSMPSVHAGVAAAPVAS
jgi:putative SOS response-associated peptidase YedK